MKLTQEQEKILQEKLRKYLNKGYKNKKDYKDNYAYIQVAIFKIITDILKIVKEV